MQLEKGKKTIIMMLDGFGIEYFRASDMPALKKMAQDGFFREGKAVFPTLTNANNISIVCGSFPQTHGVTTNCYLDPATGKPAFLEDPGFLKSPTLFEMAARQGIRSALVTSKSKTIRILGGSVDAGLSAQDADPETIRDFGIPPDIYSIEVNEWIMRSGMKILESRPDIDVLYVHTTDYPMHMWAPEEKRSLDHLSRLDHLIGEMADRYPDAAFLVTADPVTVFGTLEQERTDLHEGYRNHGSRFEQSVPLIAWNADLGETMRIQYNLDLTRALFFE